MFLKICMTRALSEAGKYFWKMLSAVLGCMPLGWIAICAISRASVKALSSTTRCKGSIGSWYLYMFVLFSLVELSVVFAGWL